MTTSKERIQEVLKLKGHINLENTLDGFNGYIATSAGNSHSSWCVKRANFFRE